MKVVIVDDHRMIREALVMLVSSTGMDVVGAFAEGHDAIVGATRLRPDAVIIDVAMPLTLALEAARQLVAAVRDIKLVALSSHLEPRDVPTVLDARFAACVSKSDAPVELQRALSAVRRGETYVSSVLATSARAHALAQKEMYARRPGEQRGRSLTDRERGVLELVAMGKSSKEIANTLSIGVPTVETHRRQMMDKLGLRTIAEGFTKYAIREGLTSVDA